MGKRLRKWLRKRLRKWQVITQVVTQVPSGCASGHANGYASAKWLRSLAPVTRDGPHGDGTKANHQGNMVSSNGLRPDLGLGRLCNDEQARRAAVEPVDDRARNEAIAFAGGAEARTQHLGVERRVAR